MAALQILPRPQAPCSGRSPAPSPASSAATCCTMSRSPSISLKRCSCYRYPSRYSHGIPSDGGIRGKLTSSAVPAASFASPSTTADAPSDAATAPLSTPSVSSEASAEVELMKVTTDSLQYESGYLGGISGKTRPSWGTSWTSSPSSFDRPSAMDYLAHTLTSRVYDVAIESPLQLAPRLSERLGVQFWLKREDLQPVFSFKLRGAYNMMANLPREKLEKGVICSSAGNHAQGVALAAQKLGCNAVIVMPVTTPEIKWKSVEKLGATVVLVGDSYDEAQSHAKKRAKSEGRTFIPPFDNPNVIMGQGTVGMEIIRQLRGPIHAIFVPVGGGLIAGIAAYVKQVRPEVKIIGVEPYDANAMALSLHHGQRVMLEQVGGFADGVAVKVVGEETYRLCRELVDGIVLVSRDAICASIKDMFEEKRSILEPAGALSLAGAEAYCKYYGLKGESVVAITSGANMNFDRLRLVTELADVGRKQEAVLATSMPEEPGSFKRFCQLVGPVNITEFKYRYDASKEKALVLYSVGVHTAAELKSVVGRMGFENFETVDLTNNDLAKDHLRHLVGGRTNVENELLCRFIFPERPGTLMKFLDSFSPRWNISLFHYRSQGEAGANVLVGIQVPGGEMDEFRAIATNLDYDYALEMSNKAYQLLMH
uniref:Threonine dehydratase n=1 Tax=Lemna minor TaxID=4472 RepID=G5CNY2_LEMMI|nr:threonine deaminase [Lemna minor]